MQTMRGIYVIRDAIKPMLYIICFRLQFPYTNLLNDIKQAYFIDMLRSDWRYWFTLLP